MHCVFLLVLYHLSQYILPLSTIFGSFPGNVEEIISAMQFFYSHVYSPSKTEFFLLMKIFICTKPGLQSQLPWNLMNFYQCFYPCALIYGFIKLLFNLYHLHIHANMKNCYTKILLTIRRENA